MSILCTFWDEKNNYLYMATDSCVEVTKKIDKSFELKKGIWIGETGFIYDIKDYSTGWDTLEMLHGEAFRYITENLNNINEISNAIHECYHKKVTDNCCCWIIGFENGEPRIIKSKVSDNQILLKSLDKEEMTQINFSGVDELNYISTEKKHLFGKYVFEDLTKAMEIMVDEIIILQKNKGVPITVGYPIKVVCLHSDGKAIVQYFEK